MSLDQPRTGLALRALGHSTNCTSGIQMDDLAAFLTGLCDLGIKGFEIKVYTAILMPKFVVGDSDPHGPCWDHYVSLWINRCRSNFSTH